MYYNTCECVCVSISKDAPPPPSFPFVCALTLDSRQLMASFLPHPLSALTVSTGSESSYFCATGKDKKISKTFSPYPGLLVELKQTLLNEAAWKRKLKYFFLSRLL